VVNGEVRDSVLTPRSFGLDPIDPSALVPGKDAKENAKILKEAVSKPESPRAAAALPNAAVALLLAGVATDLKDGAERAREAIRLGRAASVVKELVSWTS
jgi:anthranilate phosphoribosyltransferase